MGSIGPFQLLMLLAPIIVAILVVRSLRGRKDTQSLKETEAETILNGIHTVLGEYGDVLGSSDVEYRDVAELPVCKMDLAIYILTAIKLESDPQMIQHLKVGYMSLSDFQELTEEQRSAAAIWRSLISMDDIHSTQELDQLSQAITTLSPVLELKKVELEERLGELRNEGLWEA